MSDPFALTGKVALVTGATRGIGFSVAEALGRAGAQVMLSSEDGAACAAAEAALADRGITAGSHVCDVAQPGQIAALVAETVRRFGGLDVVVGNAGITGRPGTTTAIEAEDYARVMAINLTANVHLATAAAPHLRARGGGSLIFMASISGLRGNGMINSYALSKAALVQLTRNLAVELGPDNIRANAIAPGFIRTELSRPLIKDAAFMARRMQMTPLRRPGEPHEIASAAVFLAAPASAFMTGQVLVIDGGTLITDGS